jgi:hypothetical protein
MRDEQRVTSLRLFGRLCVSGTLGLGLDVIRHGDILVFLFVAFFSLIARLRLGTGLGWQEICREGGSLAVTLEQSFELARGGLELGGHVDQSTHRHHTTVERGGGVQRVGAVAMAK